MPEISAQSSEATNGETETIPNSETRNYFEQDDVQQQQTSQQVPPGRHLLTFVYTNRRFVTVGAGFETSGRRSTIDTSAESKFKGVPDPIVTFRKLCERSWVCNCIACSTSSRLFASSNYSLPQARQRELSREHLESNDKKIRAKI